MTSEFTRCLEDPGYTPPVRALDSLLPLLENAEPEGAAHLERVLARAGVPAALHALERLSSADAAARQRLLSLVGRIATETLSGLFLDPLLRILADPEPRCRRIAIRALGNLGDRSAEIPLIAALGREAPPEQRAIVEALGKVGAEAADRALEALNANDPDFSRRVLKARLLIERRTSRTAAPALAFDAPLGRVTNVSAVCRAGLAELLAEELAEFGAQAVGSERVDGAFAGSLSKLLVARTALEFGFRVSVEPHADPAEAIARALSSAEALEVFTTFTQGTPKFRLAWLEGGSQRALTWRVVQELRDRRPGLVNDPRNACWTVRASLRERELWLVPRLQPDPRFSYRVRDVPGASHPTIAAALARIGAETPSRVVWDPFVGSGLELIERARLGPWTRLIGSDLDANALDAAAANLSSAAVSGVELVRADARTLRVQDVDLILTNPPMGRRVVRDGSLDDLLDAFIENAARALVSGGRLIWLSPNERRTARAATSAGLIVKNGPNVDLGGFFARLQVFTKPERG